MVKVILACNAFSANEISWLIKCKKKKDFNGCKIRPFLNHFTKKQDDKDTKRQGVADNKGNWVKAIVEKEQ